MFIICNIYQIKVSGVSKFKLKRQISYGKEGIINFSTKPLRIASFLGSLISSVSLIYFIVILIKTLILGKDVPGYASIMCMLLFLGGIELIILGIVGEYIGEIYLEVKKRPIYVKKESLGID